MQKYCIQRMKGNPDRVMTIFYDLACSFVLMPAGTTVQSGFMGTIDLSGPGIVRGLIYSLSSSSITQGAKNPKLTSTTAWLSLKKD
jgi:hypothetical protein